MTKEQIKRAKEIINNELNSTYQTNHNLAIRCCYSGLCGAFPRMTINTAYELISEAESSFIAEIKKRE